MTGEAGGNGRTNPEPDDLASVLLGGPYGQELRGEAFNRARAYVADVFGEIT